MEGQNYATMTVVVLKGILDERNLPKTGRKADLVQRLQEHDAGQQGTVAMSPTDNISEAKPVPAAMSEPIGEAPQENGHDSVEKTIADSATENLADEVASKAETERERQASANLQAPSDELGLEAVDEATSEVSEDANAADSAPGRPVQDVDIEQPLQTVQDNLPADKASSDQLQEPDNIAPSTETVEPITQGSPSTGLEVSEQHSNSTTGQEEGSIPALDSLEAQGDTPLTPGITDNLKRKQDDQMNNVPSGKRVKTIEPERPESPAVIVKPAQKTDDSTRGHNASDKESGAQPPPSNSLYIRDITRPFHQPSFRAFLSDIAEQEPLNLVLDHFKTHAYVVFKDTSAAERVKKLLHGKPYPEGEKNRKRLSVEFLATELVEKFVAQEEKADKSTKWEVKYSLSNGEHSAELVKANDERISGQFSPAVGKKEKGVKVLKLDDLFRRTTTKPMLYFLPARKQQQSGTAV